MSGRSITKATFACWITTVLLISGILTLFFVYQKYSDFEDRERTVRVEFNQFQKVMLEKEVRNLFKYLGYKYNAMLNELRFRLKDVTERTAENLETVLSSEPALLKDSLKKALQKAVNLANPADPLIKCFAVRPDGSEVFKSGAFSLKSGPYSPAEQKRKHHNGLAFLREIISSAEKNGETFFNAEFPLSRRRTGNFDATGYAVYIKKYNIIFGFFEYMHDWSATSQKQVISDLRSIKFGVSKEGNVFIMNSRGTMLLYPEPLFENRNMGDFKNEEGRRPFNEIVRKALGPAHGGYVDFKMSSPSDRNNTGSMLVYTSYFPGWDWIVSSGLFVSDIGQVLNAERNKLKMNLYIEVVYILILSLMVTFAAIRFSYVFSAAIKKQLDMIMTYFRESVGGGGHLSEDDFTFEEFRFIASSAIAMVKKIRTLIDRVKELAIKAEISSRSKSNFLATISHELRKPLTGIMGMANILKNTKLDDEQKSFVDSIISSGESLVAVVDDIRDFSSIETGETLEVRIEPFDLPMAIGDVVEQLADRASSKGLKLESDISKDIPVYLNGDADRIKQILVTLGENAIRFTEEGGITLKISLERQEDEKFFVNFKVKDTGIGISREKQEILFDFEREELASSSRVFAGVSLALAVCKNLAEIMGGTLQVSSEKEKGSEFGFTLSLERSSDEQVQKVKELEKITSRIREDEKAGKKESRQIKARVLLAEDDPVNRNVALMYLKRIGCETETARNGREAVEKYKSGKYDLVFMDCEMPEMDGYEATKAIREYENSSGTGHIPVVAMTAYAMQKDKEMSKEAGMDFHITKPASEDSIIQILHKYAGENKS